MTRARRLRLAAGAGLVLLALRLAFTWQWWTVPYVVGSALVAVLLGALLAFSARPSAEERLVALGRRPWARGGACAVGGVLVLLSLSYQLALLTLVWFPLLLAAPWEAWGEDPAPEDAPRRVWHRPWAWVALGAGLRLAYLLARGEDAGDGASRAFYSWEWSQAPHLIVPAKQLWGSLHFYLLGCAQAVTGEPSWTPRLVSWVCGVATLVLAHRLTLRLYGPRAALWSLVLLVCYGLHVWLSSVSLSEVPYGLLLVAGLLAFARAQEEDRLRTKPLVLAAVCMGLAGAVRYEAWIVACCLPLFSAAGPREVWRTATFRHPRSLPWAAYLLVAGIYPVWWTVLSATQTGDPFMAFTMVTRNVQQASPRLPLNVGLLTWWEGLWITFGPGALLGVLGAVWARGRVPRALACTAGFLLAFFSYKTATHTATAQYRYMLGFVLLILPCAGVAMARLEAGWTARWRRPAAVLVVAWLVCAGGVQCVREWERLPDDARQVAAWLGERRDGGGRVLMDQDWFEGARVALHARARPGQLLQVTPAGEKGIPYGAEELERDLATPGLAWVIVCSDGRLPGLVPDPAARGWREERRSGRYVVYRLPMSE